VYQTRESSALIVPIVPLSEVQREAPRGWEWSSLRKVERIQPSSPVHYTVLIRI